MKTRININSTGPQNLSIRAQFFLAYAFAAIPYSFYFKGRQIVYVLLFIIIAYMAHSRRSSYPISFKLYLLLVVELIIFQSITFFRFSLTNFYGVLINILYAFFLISLLHKNTYKYYTSIVLIITIISFIFYFPSLISTTIHSLIGKIPHYLKTDYLLKDQNFIIYTWERYSTLGLLRNSGNYTEPGSFSAYLNLALIFNIIHKKQILNKINILLIIAIITTFSTAGYISLFIIIMGFTISQKKVTYQIIAAPIIIFVSIYSFQHLPFLQEKINKQLYAVEYKGLNTGRFGSAVNDLKDFKKYPLRGRGLLKVTRFDEIRGWNGDQSPRSLSNGLTNQVVRYGVLGFIIYILLMFRSLRMYLREFDINQYYVFYIIAAIFAAAFSQSVLENAPFLGLLFIGDFVSRKKKANNENIYYHSQL